MLYYSVVSTAVLNSWHGGYFVNVKWRFVFMMKYMEQSFLHFMFMLGMCACSLVPGGAYGFMICFGRVWTWRRYPLTGPFRVG